MEKLKFSKSKICENKIEEIINESIPADSRIAFRIIFHDNNISLKKEDFYPTIMERNKNAMPDDTKQSKCQIGVFGVSVLNTYDKAVEYKEFCPSLRKKSPFCIAKGKVNENKGRISVFDENGHYEYFLYDPIDNNPYCDFGYCKKEK